jgi:Sec-independent protein secretion pathway component TatC
MALPLMGLYELSILLARVFGKKPKEVAASP